LFETAIRQSPCAKGFLDHLLSDYEENLKALPQLDEAAIGLLYPSDTACFQSIAAPAGRLQRFKTNSWSFVVAVP
jgi:hypothetical protein